MINPVRIFFLTVNEVFAFELNVGWFNQLNFTYTRLRCFVGGLRPKETTRLKLSFLVKSQF